ncbi:MAG: hypothetical protein AAGG45_03180 [Pseudomonadota bacterium]
MGATYYEKQERVGYVWRPALHYGLAYTLFALTIRALREEVYRVPDIFIAGFGFGGFCVLSWSLWSAGQRRRARHGPKPQKTTANIVSGFAAVTIVGATVMAFLFRDVSILLALLLMRLGVLMLAPFIDRFSGRMPSKAALLAAAICGLGCISGSMTNTFSALSWPVSGVLCIYLTGYAVRLSLMTRYAKTPVRSARGDWFMIEVQITAFVMLLISTLMLAQRLTSSPDFILREWQALTASLLCGLAYGYAFVHGTLIYLDWRDNVRAVTINRSASLLAGVMASLIGWALLGMNMPTFREWMLAGFMAVALFIMGADSLKPIFKSPPR